MSLLFETIRIERKVPVNLQLHQDRFDTARKHLFNLPSIPLKDVIETGGLDIDIVYRCRIDYGKEIESIEITPYEPRITASLKMVAADDIDYSYKYSDRSELEKLFGRRGETDDVLIIKHGKVTDTSAANIVFAGSGKFCTPAAPLLGGTHRKHLIERGIIVEAEISYRDISKYEGWQLINAMNPFNENRFISTRNIIPG